MTDLAAWLLEQVTEDERGARAAAAELQQTLPGLPARTVPNAWVAIEYDCEGISVWQQETEGGYTPTGDGATSTTDHITRWDPARVLAECMHHQTATRDPVHHPVRRVLRPVAWRRGAAHPRSAVRRPTWVQGGVAPVSDLATWLLEQIDADEKQARTAAVTYGAVWRVRDNAGEMRGRYPVARHVAATGKHGWLVSSDDSSSGDPGQHARHIAAWDPARVLAECEVKRLLVEEFDSCGDLLKILALPYADQPGYDEAWRP